MKNNTSKFNKTIVVEPIINTNGNIQYFSLLIYICFQYNKIFITKNNCINWVEFNYYEK